MKRVWFVISLVLLCCLPAGCSGRESGEIEPEVREYYDIQTETEQVFDMEETDSYIFLGMQFYQEERVQIWAEKPFFAEDGTLAMEGDVYLHREDGNRELIFKDIPYRYFSGTWWLDAEGRCFVLRSDGILRLGGDGEEIFSRQTGGNVKDICQLADGRIMLLLAENRNDRIAEINPGTGAVDFMENVALRYGNQYIGAEGNALLLLDMDGLWEINTEDGSKTCRMAFAGTSYVWETGVTRIEAFQVSEGGEVELLWSNGTAETLLLSRVDEDRIPVVMRGFYFSNWMKEQVVRFNKFNSAYYIVLEEWENGDGQDFLERTDMEIARGKGADIIFSSSVNDAYSLIAKGAFEDLYPYMVESGIEETDYFPLAFSCRGDGGSVYGIKVIAEVEGIWFDRKVVSSSEGLDIEALADSMLASDGKAVFMKGYGAADVLRYFLQGSEDLWGTLDWERRVCDFSGELFAKLMEAAKQYGDSEASGYPAIAGNRNFSSFYWFDSIDGLKSDGKVSVGYLFDDGCHEMSSATFLAVNANSAQKQGAWKFISFLLGEEVQETIDLKNNYTVYFPVCKRVFETLKEEAIDSGTFQEGKWTVSYGSITEAQAEELTAAIEGARQLPMQTEPILRIICEEAQYYFTGAKNLEEVCAVIENRVQLYLNEKN